MELWRRFKAGDTSNRGYISTLNRWVESRKPQTHACCERSTRRLDNAAVLRRHARLASVEYCYSFIFVVQVGRNSMTETEILPLPVDSAH